MIAIDNSALISPTTGIGVPQPNPALFIAGATWTYSTTITVTDTSTITAPDTFAKSNVIISDQSGNSAYGHISAAAGNTGGIVVTGLKSTDYWTIAVTTVSTLGVEYSGVSQFVTVATTSGTIGYWDISVQAIADVTA